MSGNDLFFASLQGVIEIVRQHVDKLDARGVEQHGDGGDEHDGENVAAQCRQRPPWKHAEVGQVPGPRQPHRRRGLERPAVGPGLGKCDAGEGKGEMGHGNSGEQDAR